MVLNEELAVLHDFATTNFLWTDMLASSSQSKYRKALNWFSMVLHWLSFKMTGGVAHDFALQNGLSHSACLYVVTLLWK